MRENEDDDLEHGKRGAALLRQLASEGWISLTPTQLYYVLHACETHTTAPPTPVLPIGVCYDADRLTLWRVWITPKEEYLSTPLGKELARKKATETFHETPPEWDEVLEELFVQGKGAANRRDVTSPHDEKDLCS
jgi:hypothetical protein